MEVPPNDRNTTTNIAISINFNTPLIACLAIFNTPNAHSTINTPDTTVDGTAPISSENIITNSYK